MSSSIPSTMKAVVVRETGNSEKLLFETEYPTPTIKPGFALVQNSFAGVNFIDTYHRSGLYARDLPFIAGQEGGGTIVSLHENDGDESSIQIGDRVVYGVLETYCEYTLVPLAKIVVVPTNISLKDAVACYIQGLTSHYLVNSAHAGLIQPHQWMLIYSVGSGTGQWAAQMARLKGYKVIGTCSTSKVTLELKNMVDELISIDNVPGKGYADYESHSERIVDRVMDITCQQGVHCILDGVGRATSETSLQCLAARGIFVSFGNASGAVLAFPLLRLVGKSTFVTRPKLGDYISTHDELQARMNDIFAWMEKKQLTVRVDKVCNLEDAKVAHDYIQDGHTTGKLLLKI